MRGVAVTEEGGETSQGGREGEDCQPPPGEDRSVFQWLNCLSSASAGYGEQDIRHQYQNFMKICPDGSLTKKIFMDFSRKLYGHHAKQLSVAICDIFDQARSGKIDFVEYIMVDEETMFGHLLHTININ